MHKACSNQLTNSIQNYNKHNCQLIYLVVKLHYKALRHVLQHFTKATLSAMMKQKQQNDVDQSMETL